jgi:AraC-like DNA-binding protein
VALLTEAIASVKPASVDTLLVAGGHAPALRALLQTALSLKEVAAQVEYANQGQFSTAFLRRFGVRPGLFREMQG